MIKSIRLIVVTLVVVGAPLAGCGRGKSTPKSDAPASMAATPAAPVQPPARIPGTVEAGPSSPGGASQQSAFAAAQASRTPRELSIEETTIDALGRIGKPAVAALVRALRDPDPRMRERAARLLARIGPDAQHAVPDLMTALSDPDEDVRKAVIRALGQIGPAAGEAVPALMQQLRSSLPESSQPRPSDNRSVR